MNHRKTQAAALAVTTLFSASTFAHVGTHMHASFSDGFLHPLTGLDHLTALILIGVFAAHRQFRSAVAIVAFVSVALMAGFIIGVDFAHAEQVELFVTLSLIAFPMAFIAYRFGGLAKLLAVCAMAVFSACHGLVQGAEASGSVMLFGFGSVVASVMVIALTAGVTRLVKQAVQAFRVEVSV